MKRTLLPLIVVMSMVSLLAGSCGDDNESAHRRVDVKTPTKTVGGTIELEPLFYTEGRRGPEGGSSTITLSLEETDTEAIRVAIADDEVGGSGPQWEASAWNAMAVSTLVTGASLDHRELEVDATGFIDGPSAGALLTVGTIALILGDDIDSDVTMTGTINPDGTIGPVGGIQYKLDGAEKAGKDLVLIPTGQMTEEDETGNVVDLNDVADDLGIRVKEVDNIYEAYEEFTGKELERFQSNDDPALTSAQKKTLTKIVESYQDEYDDALSQLSTEQITASSLQLYERSAQRSRDESEELVDDGQPAAALAEIRDAYGVALSMVGIVEFDEARSQRGDLAGNRVIEKYDEEFIDLFDDFSEDLEDYEPETLGHSANLIDSYGVANVAIALETIAFDEFNNTEQTYDPVNVMSYIQTAYAGLKIQTDVFEAFSDVKGPEIQNDVDPDIVAKFFRQSADANIAAFKSTILTELQNELGVSAEQAEAALKQVDPSVAIAFNSQDIERLSKEVFGNIDNLPYAQLGAAVELYARSSELLAGYYSLGVPSFENGSIAVNEFRSKEAFRAAKKLAKEQLSGVGTILSQNDIEPVFVASAFELADQDDSGVDPSEAIRSLRIYWKGFVAGRVLTYLGGFPREGLKN